MKAKIKWVTNFPPVWKQLGVPGACWARAAADGLDEPESWGCGEVEPPKADRLRSLYEFLRPVPEFPKPRGVRH